MTDAPEKVVRGDSLRLGIAVAAMVFVTVFGFIALPLAESRGHFVASLAWVPMVVMAVLVLRWNSHWGLCFAAFAIAPLGIVQHEILSVTLNLPEVLILVLAAKEALRCILRKERLVEHMPVRATGLYLCAAMTAIVTGLAYANGLRSVLQDFRQFTEFVLLFWLVLQRVTDRRQVVQITLCYVFGITLVAIHGIVQHFLPIGIPSTQIASDLFLYNQVRSGSFYGATTLGGLMVLGVGPATGLALASKGRALKLAVLVCIGLCLVAAVYTNTRASWMGMMVLFAFLAVSIRPSARTLAVAAAGAIALATTMGPSIVQRMSTLSVAVMDSHAYGAPVTDTSLLGRVQYYTVAAHILRRHSIFGLGWGCYYEIDRILYDERYVKIPRPPGAADSTVHSAYLQLFVKTGAFGLLAFFVILVVWAERIWRARRSKPRNNRHYALFVGITAGLVGYLFHSTFENFFQWPVMAQSFWLLFGLSFLTAGWTDSRKQSSGLPRAFVGVAIAVFLLFVYGFPRLVPLMAASHPDHFERDFAKAMVEGNVPEALRIARRATQLHRPGPIAYTLLGRVLLESGKPTEALEQLDRAVGLGREPWPVRGESQKPYFFAPARLTLGKYYLDRGDSLEAVANFELARAYAAPADPEYRDFHPALYQAYADQGLWARALEFGEPSDGELDGLDSQSIVRIARVCEGAQNWELASRLAKLLLSRGVYTSEAHHLLGRTDLAQERYDASLVHLEQAVSNGHARSAFFLGAALEKAGNMGRAIQAYLRTPAGDLYRPFALARALTLLDSSPEGGASASTLKVEELLSQLDGEIARMRLSQRPILYDEYRGLVPVAVLTPEFQFASGGRFPALILWEDGQAATADRAPITLSGSGVENSTWLLRRKDSVLQLQWVENLVNWESVDRLRPGATIVPGWIDTARDRLRLWPDHAARIDDDGSGNSFLSIPEVGWLFSTPIRTRDRGGYLLSARLRDPQGKGWLGWLSFDDEERVLISKGIFDGKRSDAWTWQAGYMRSQRQWDTLRIQLDVTRPGGTIAIDDVLLIEIDEPD